MSCESFTTAGPDLSLGVPDWTLRMSSTFTLVVSRSVLHDAAERIEQTHAYLRCWWDIEHDITVWQGNYGEDRAACVAALSPLMDAFTAWRDGHRAVSEYKTPQ